MVKIYETVKNVVLHVYLSIVSRTPMNLHNSHNELKFVCRLDRENVSR